MQDQDFEYIIDDYMEDFVIDEENRQEYKTNINEEIKQINEYATKK